jgi:peptidoglycan/xylan/chitin deacetylase (PgdA/CDA1 family)
MTRHGPPATPSAAAGDASPSALCASSPAAAVALSLGTGVLANLAPALARAPAVSSHLPSLNGDGDIGRVALTFDDGPDQASTPHFLDCLERLDVGATFFLLGIMVERAPTLARELTARGHEVAVHGWDHRSLALRGPSSTRRQIEDGAAIVEDRTGQVPTWWRPPYGVLTTAGIVSARRADLAPVLWGSWGRDWRRSATASTVTADVTAGFRPGTTVLLHDSSCTAAPGSWRSALDALPDLVHRWREEGLTVGPLRDHGIRA